jgi:hypothetical protein
VTDLVTVQGEIKAQGNYFGSSSPDTACCLSASYPTYCRCALVKWQLHMARRTAHDRVGKAVCGKSSI